MLDTLQIKKCFLRAYTDDELHQIGAIHIHSRRNRIYALNPQSDSTLPRITFVFTPNGLMHVSAECSIPRMLFGFNSRLPTEFETIEGLQMISEYMTAKTGLDFDAVNAKVGIAHFANDIQLGEPAVYAAVNRLKRVKMKGLIKNVVEDTTIYFQNKSRDIRIYPKLQEVNAKNGGPEAIEAARGNLRFEYCLVNNYGVASLVDKFGLIDRTAKSLLRSEVSERIFSKLFEEIDFPNLLTNDKSNLQMLKDRFPTRKAMMLDGFLGMVDQFGPLFFKDSQHEFKKGAYYRSVNDCRKAGVWRTGEWDS